MASYSSTFLFSVSLNLLTFLILHSVAQSPSTNQLVPPLQWIELTNLVSGPAPPPLMYSSMGYDENSRTLLIFGGEQNGNVQQQTYLLNLTSLTWYAPTPPTAPVGINILPPARSAAISGNDYAASYRHGFVVIGGKGSDDKGLGDAWIYDWIEQFWSNISISSGDSIARYGASGGVDASVPDPANPDLNSTFYMAGGYTGTLVMPLSNLFEFQTSGVQSSNNDNDVFGSWQQVSFQTLPSKVRQASAVMPGGNVVSYGGCSTADFVDIDCAGQDSYTLDVASERYIVPNICPAPRVGASLVPNRNGLLSNFENQAFLLLGLFNTTLWDDQDGLAQGEVDVLDTQLGSWSRVLASGDPGSDTTDNTVKFPKPREGSAAFSSPLALVGDARTTSSDTIIFGGRDVNGIYLNDLWLLRAYLGNITETNGTWSGFGNGQLETGVDASGAGVTVQFMTACASTISQPSGTTTISPSGTSITSSPQSSVSPPSLSTTTFDAPIYHKLLSPLSIALLLLVFVVFRIHPTAVIPLSSRQGIWSSLSVIVLLVTYILGIAGIVTAFSSTTIAAVNVRQRAVSGIALKSSHAKAGLIFFVALYGVFPLIFLVVQFCHLWKKTSSEILDGDGGKTSNGTSLAGLQVSEKHDVTSETHRHGATPSESSLGRFTHATSRQRTYSWCAGHIWPGSRNKERIGRQSSESALETSDETIKGFEVLNRHPRVRRASSNGGVASYGDRRSSSSRLPHSLSDLSWLDRRRSVNVAGELDYVLSQISRPSQEGPMIPDGDRPNSEPLLALNSFASFLPELPSPAECFLHIVLHILIFGICVVSLAELWSRAPLASFVIFLIWVLAFYVIILILAWKGKPRTSVLTVFIYRLRGGPSPHLPVSSNSPPHSRPPSLTVDAISSSDSRSPYIYHQPLYHRAVSSPNEDDYMSSNLHMFPNFEDAGDDEDEDTQQRRIEQELDRREVNIVTVPRRKLWITNPS